MNLPHAPSHATTTSASPGAESENNAAPWDVLIIGAGLSGIGMACHLREQLPQARFVLLEQRATLGGTWDVFRYPGVRSDSDMFTYAYGFRPWQSADVLASAERIRNYLHDTAQAYALEPHIRYRQQVLGADWDSQRQLWSVRVRQEGAGDAEQVLQARFVVHCSGYYDHAQGHQPQWPGQDQFAGRLVHPQHWPRDLEVRGQRIVVIGSGATAATLVPALVREGAAQVTMLQRSPTYFVSVPYRWRSVRWLSQVLPQRWVFGTTRTLYLRLQRALYTLARKYPVQMRRYLLRDAKRRLGPEVDMRHFTPRYSPWEQRLCVIPEGDLLRVLRNGQAQVVTDEIERFTPEGLTLRSGASLQADVVISATGLKLKTLGGVALRLDGQPFDVRRQLTWRAVLLQDLPNSAFMMGYINASWTLKSDLAAQYVCRLLKHMQQHGLGVVAPRAPQGMATDANAFDPLNAGYVLRDRAELPRQGRSGPWQVTHAYEQDRQMLLNDPLDDGNLEFAARRI